MDVGNNYSVLDNPNICFVYEYVGSKDSDREQSQYVSVAFCVVWLGRLFWSLLILVLDSNFRLFWQYRRLIREGS